jgi:hypothetical protein
MTCLKKSVLQDFTFGSQAYFLLIGIFTSQCISNRKLFMISTTGPGFDSKTFWDHLGKKVRVKIKIGLSRAIWAWA